MEEKKEEHPRIIGWNPWIRYGAAPRDDELKPLHFPTFAEIKKVLLKPENKTPMTEVEVTTLLYSMG